MQTRENPRFVTDRIIAVTDRTLNTLILELGRECQTVMALINQQTFLPQPFIFIANVMTIFKLRSQTI